MKKYLNALLTAALLSFVVAFTVNAQSSCDFRPDYDYYDDEFDWRWDIRVRISDGINNGLITRSEANRLYRKLENIEEKEYFYAADGVYDAWEQNDVWQDVQWLHERVGLELRDNDRTYYGFNRVGVAYYGYPNWWYNGGYNFYRFDNRGFGSVRIGYAPQYYVPVWVPNRTIYVNNYRTYGHTYYRNDGRNRVVYNERAGKYRNTTNAPRTNGRSSSAVYNRSANTPGTPDNNNSVNRAEARTREYSRSAATTERPAAVNRSYAGRSESLNNASRTTGREREYSRPTAPRNEGYSSPGRSSAESSDSFNRSTNGERATPSSTYSRSSSSRNSVGSSEGRTKLPEARRSSSSANESRPSSTTGPRRGN